MNCFNIKIKRRNSIVYDTHDLSEQHNGKSRSRMKHNVACYRWASKAGHDAIDGRRLPPRLTCCSVVVPVRHTCPHSNPPTLQTYIRTEQKKHVALNNLNCFFLALLNLPFEWSTRLTLKSFSKSRFRNTVEKQNQMYRIYQRFRVKLLNQGRSKIVQTRKRKKNEIVVRLLTYI